jgi:hypothetical protein
MFKYIADNITHNIIKAGPIMNPALLGGEINNRVMAFEASCLQLEKEANFFTMRQGLNNRNEVATISACC